MSPNDDNIVEVHFEHFFQCAKGHAKLIDEFNFSRRPPCYSSDEDDRIEFHQRDHVDLDYLVKTCYLIKIALVSEA